MDGVLEQTVVPTATARSACKSCGLPATHGSDYCCYGCKLVFQIKNQSEEDHGSVRGALMFSAILAMAVMMLSLFLYAEDVYGATAADGLVWMRQIYRFASAVLCTPVVLLAGVPLAEHAVSRLRSGNLSMSALIVTAAGAAYALSIANLFTASAPIYFDSAAAALVLATLGRYLEAVARTRASASLAPTLAQTETPVDRLEGSNSRPLHRAEIEVGMKIRVRPEQPVPVDLELGQEHADVDLGILTGEAEPVRFQRGDMIPSGAVPVGAAIIGTALREAQTSTAEKLSELAASLEARPSTTMRFADRLATYLTPLVWILSLTAGAAAALTVSLGAGVETALSVVLVACPCTFVIATPLVYWLALKAGVREGLLIRDAATIDRLARVDRVAFDKTGTLTSRTPRVALRELNDGVARAEVAALARALEDGWDHPIARGIANWAQDASPIDLIDRKVAFGIGVTARDSEGRKVSIGRDPQDGSRIALIRDGQWLARFGFQEDVRPDAAHTVEWLNRDGLPSLILTGDSQARGQATADELGVDLQSELTPGAKAEVLSRLGATTAMVGDGSNDAPAIAQNVSFAMQKGTHLARALADVVVVRDDLRLVPRALEIARGAHRRAKAMLLLAVGYNIVFLALAATGHLLPVFAGISMLLSSFATLAGAAHFGSQLERAEGLA